MYKKIHKYSIKNIFSGENITKSTFKLYNSQQISKFQATGRNISGIAYAGSHKTFIISLHKNETEDKIHYYYVKLQKNDKEEKVVKRISSFNVTAPETTSDNTTFFQSGICYDYEKGENGFEGTLYTSMCRKNLSDQTADNKSLLMTVDVNVNPNNGTTTKDGDSKTTETYVSPHSGAKAFEFESVAVKTKNGNILAVARCNCSSKGNHAAVYKLN